MATPRYIAKKMGDHYVLERHDPAATAEDCLWASLGGVLTLCGFVRGGPLGWLAVLSGGSMICRAITGRNPLCSVLSCGSSAAPETGPSHQNDARPTSQVPDDAVDEASMESFPGSDAPARTPVAAAGAGAGRPN